ncbi:MAG: class I SAM-dependent methyltransferase [Thermodesulfobacteriota bacterium]
MDFKEIYYPESRFGGFTNLDGNIIFYTRINALLKPSSVVLDIGCGRGAYGADSNAYRRNLHILKGKCRRVIGIDVDPAAKDNPYIDEFHLIKENGFPVETESIDLAICDHVLEHVAEPEKLFSECQRIIRPLGILCMRTTNSLGYVGLISKLIPNRFHERVLKKAKHEKEGEDIFPTYYRCNTIGKLRRMLNKYGFDHCVYGYEAEPMYLSFSRFCYRLGVLHQRFAPNIIKLAIFAFGKKVE